LAAFTVSEVLLLTDPKAAEMLVPPTLLAVARPLVVIEATAVEEDFQVTTAVTSWLVPSENDAVAVNC
jgi:hypothetical protein